MQRRQIRACSRQLRPIALSSSPESRKLRIVPTRIFVFSVGLSRIEIVHQMLGTRNDISAVTKALMS
ncbi:hypothetical protein XH80_26615 [Bradyrhizobium sp. CCBAU 45384]|nr:hypothetical protein [Bradyrhizobium sp. CCBAU 45384]